MTRPLRAVVVAEYYPRVDDPVLGVWAHRQAVATRDAGAEVRVLVLHRVIPPRSTPTRQLPRALVHRLRHPRRLVRDGLEITFLPFVSPLRGSSYGSWGAWAAPALALGLRRLRREGFDFDVVHAHYGVPAGDAVRRARPRRPVLVSVHGGDGLFDRLSSENVARAYRNAAVVLCNSRGTAERALEAGARTTRVVHLGADIPASLPHKRDDPTIVSVAHLVERKRQGDVLRALWLLRDRHPRLRYVLVGDGPERRRLEELATRLGLRDRVDFLGQLPNEEAVRVCHSAHVFALPSVEEAFGVAYVEAMAGGVPAIACLGEPGPAELEDAGFGMALVPPGDIDALARAIDEELSQPPRVARERAARVRATIAAQFTWGRCGEATLEAYGVAVRSRREG